MSKYAGVKFVKSNRPIPESTRGGRGSGRSSAIRGLEVGECLIFDIDTEEAIKFSCQISAVSSAIRKRENDGRKYSVRITPEGCGVWRTA